MQAPIGVQIIQNIVPHLGTQATSLEKVLRTLCAKIETLESYISAISNGVTEMDQRLRTIAHNIEGSTDAVDAGSVIHFPLERKLSERASSNVVDNIIKKFGPGTKVRHHRHRHHTKAATVDETTPDMSQSRTSAPAVESPSMILEEDRRSSPLSSNATGDTAVPSIVATAAAPEIATPAAVEPQTASEATSQEPLEARTYAAAEGPLQEASEAVPQATPENPIEMAPQVARTTEAPTDAALDAAQATAIASDTVDVPTTPIEAAAAVSALDDNQLAAPTTAPIASPAPLAVDEAAMSTEPLSAFQDNTPGTESIVTAPQTSMDASDVAPPVAAALPLRRSQTVPPMHMDALSAVGLVVVRMHAAPKVAHAKVAPIPSATLDTTPQTAAAPVSVTVVSSPERSNTSTEALPRVRSKQGSMRRLSSLKRNSIEAAPCTPPLRSVDTKSNESGSDSYSDDDDVDTVVDDPVRPPTPNALSREEIARRKVLGKAAWEKLRKKQFLLTKTKGNILTTKKKDVFTIARRLEMLEKHSKELFAGSKQTTLDFHNTIADLTTRVQSELAAKADVTSVLFVTQLQNDAERSIQSLLDDVARLQATKADLSTVEANKTRTKDAIDKLTKDLESLQRKLGVMSMSYDAEFASLETRHTTWKKEIDAQLLTIAGQIKANTTRIEDSRRSLKRKADLKMLHELEEAILHHKAKEDGMCIARCLSCHKEVTENPAEKSDDEAAEDDNSLLKKINPSVHAQKQVYRSSVPLHATLQHLETSATEAPMSPGPFRPLNLVAGKKVLKARPGTAPIRAKGSKKLDA
ncbi:hypothetical protein SPRG_11468 [Saprolegnia parasitica CBS 223.65]|uniref:Uncharacterized protein n=1 Tax=Saprolegnia parasitica (strain CBS 223.65) TaxID=695850 RepID=A0A067CA08_SAPPC|nr:hypothetical protein SPRG_11468 [Saprolegnia parasitica CBS 223.65]KDO23376.1 hypothetical protein SPRG_11468 [Saprolegnia parasitica CBS 223.65]|eukprot:XP_012205866.1 hypothetical protein SPRG_11468 [Saprolegnia parasitica CBS 223.65]